MPSLFLGVLLAGVMASPKPGEQSTVCLKSHIFSAEVRETLEEKAIGLMGRASLTKDHCMFFVYEADGQHRIWMKNCLISIDVLWVREDGTIVEIVEDAPPCSPLRKDDCPSYGGKVFARHFIEFPTGTVKRLKVKVGDKVGWRLHLQNGRWLVGGLRRKK